MSASDYNIHHSLLAESVIHRWRVYKVSDEVSNFGDPEQTVIDVSYDDEVVE